MSTRYVTRNTVRLRASLAIGIEGLWLAGLVLVPLAFRGREWVAFFSQPKFVVLHGVALSIVVLWALELALSARINRRDGAGSVFASLDLWPDGRPQRWAIIAVGAFGVAFLASTLLSPLPSVSTWGRDFGDQGYELYSTLSYLVIFGAIALRLRSRKQVERLLTTVVVTSTLVSVYAITQHFGWDPIGRGPDSQRVFSSLGNPLSLGALLVMTVPLTLAWGVATGHRWRTQILAVTAVLIGLQLAALWFAGGRGPWIGATVALLAFALLAGVWTSRQTGLRALAVGLGGAITMIVIANIPGGQLDPGRGLDNLRDVFSETRNALLFMFDRGPVLAEITEAAMLEELGSIDEFGPTNARSTALTNRADIWRASVDLAWSRDRPAPESSLVRGLRVLFGFGPDMFFYSYPLAARPLDNIESASHAHDYALQVLMEQGLAGLITILVTAALLLLAAWRVLRSRNSEAWVTIVLIGTLAALTGRVADQFTGVARVSDLLLFWAVTGLLIAVAEINDGHSSSESGSAGTVAGRGGRLTPRVRTSFGARQAAYLAGAGVVAILALVIFVQRDLNPLRGGMQAANGFEQKAVSGAAALRSFERAIDLAPNVERYYLEAAALYSAAAGQRSEPQEAGELLLAARDQLLAYEVRDPFAWQTQLDLATVAAALVANGNSEFTAETVGRYRNVSALMPAFAPIQTTAARQVVIAGDYRLGITIANLAISLEAETAPSPGAWWARGEAAYQLDRMEEARIAFETAISRAPDSAHAAASHRGLAFIAEIAGDGEAAAEHHARADELGG